MIGLTLAEIGHIVNALPPIDINSGKNSDVFSLKGHAHATIFLTLGVTGAATTVTVEECDDFTPTNYTAIPFSVYKEESAAGDTLGARTAVVKEGFATSTADNIMYVIEVDAADLTLDRTKLRVCLSNPSATTIGSILVVLSGSRFGEDQSATAIA
jgi:hypothetical protein